MISEFLLLIALLFGGSIDNPPELKEGDTEQVYSGGCPGGICDPESKDD